MEDEQEREAALQRLENLGDFSRDDVEQAVSAAQGNVALAAQFLIEGGPPPTAQPVDAPRVFAGPGTIVTSPAAFATTPYRLLALARESGQQERLRELVKRARHGTFLQVGRGFGGKGE